MAYSVVQIEQALRQSGGICAEAARLLSKSGQSITRCSVAERVKKSERLQQAIRETKEATLDLAESKLMGQIQKDNMTAIIFYLKTQGKQRGYVERQETTGADGGPVQYLQMVRNADAELKRFEAAQEGTGE